MLFTTLVDFEEWEDIQYSQHNENDARNENDGWHDMLVSRKINGKSHYHYLLEIMLLMLSS